MTRGGGHMLSEKSQRTQNGTMFVDLDWPLDASRQLSASAELLVSADDKAINVLTVLVGQQLGPTIHFTADILAF